MNNLVTLAPASVDVHALFMVWQHDHTGTVDDFYAFITTPSPARRLFLHDAQYQAPDPAAVHIP